MPLETLQGKHIGNKTMKFSSCLVSSKITLECPPFHIYEFQRNYWEALTKPFHARTMTLQRINCVLLERERERCTLRLRPRQRSSSEQQNRNEEHGLEHRPRAVSYAGRPGTRMEALMKWRA